MNRAEREILGPSIKRVRNTSPHLWWELKRQIWDFGSQAFYPRQGEYDIPARRALAALDESAVVRLTAEWQRQNPGAQPTKDKVLSYYEAVVIEEIVRRASIAAYRTNEW
jgi:hypothetical protein